MKKLLGKRFHRIPVALVSVLLVVALVTGGALAAVLPSAEQTITQTLEEWDYGSITAPPTIDLPTMKVGENVREELVGAVIVEVGPDSEGKYLHFKIDEASTNLDLYQFFTVSLTSDVGDNVMEEMLVLGVNSNTGPESSIQLTVAGTYTFKETINAKAKDTPGTAEVKLIITLEDDPYVAP